MYAIPFTEKNLGFGSLRRHREIVILVEVGRPKNGTFSVNSSVNDVFLFFLLNYKFKDQNGSKNNQK